MSSEALYDRIRDLRRENERLRGEVDRLSLELDSAEFRIRQELEPRIKREDRSYDRWATSPERGMD